MTITTTFNSLEELVSFAHSLTEEAAGKVTPEQKKAPEESRKAEEPLKEQEQQSEEAKQEAAVEDLPFTYTLEEVRAKLASLPKAAARELIKNYGCSRLTEIPAEHYPELMQKAGAVHA